MTIRVCINPGTEAAPDATVENAAEAVRLFVEDLALPFPVGVQRMPDSDILGTDIGDGRFEFILSTRWGTCVVDMPGCNPKVTRASIPWTSPRLYVDSSSWLWNFALSIASELLCRGWEDTEIVSWRNQR